MPRKTIIPMNEVDGCKLTDKALLFNKAYLDKSIKMLDSMSREHSRVSQTRMDFRYPQDMQSDGTNRIFSRAIQTLNQELTKEGYDPRYCARREQKKQHNPHYHLCIMVNGNKQKQRSSLVEKAEKHWANALGLTQQEVHEKKLIYPCNHDPEGNPRPNGYVLDRNADDYEETRGKMIRQMSYLTKCDPCDTTPSPIRKFFTSQNTERKATTQKPPSRKSK